MRLMTFRTWSRMDDSSVILAWNNYLDIPYLAILLCSPYNSLGLRSMDWVSMTSYCLCNSLLIEVSMIHLIVKLSFFYILYVDTFFSVASSPTSCGLGTSRIYESFSWVQFLNFSTNPHNWDWSTYWNLKFLAMIVKIPFIEFNLQ